MRKSIATTPSLNGNIINGIDFKAINKAGAIAIIANGDNNTDVQAGKQRTIVVGTIMNYAQSPSERGSPSTPTEIGDIYQLGGGGGPPGGDGDGEPPDDEDGHVGNGNGGRND